MSFKIFTVLSVLSVAEGFLAAIVWFDFEHREQRDKAQATNAGMDLAPPVCPPRRPSSSALELMVGHDSLVSVQRSGLAAVVEQKDT